MAHLTLGVRNNAVGIRRAGWLTDRIREVRPSLRVELRPVATSLDRRREGEAVVGRSAAGAEELWEELRGGSLDVAWLDLRDTTWPLPDDIHIATCFTRQSPRDALVHKLNVGFGKLPPGSRLATASAASRMQVAAERPDIVWIPLSGDLPTRLHKVHLQQVEGVVEPASDLLTLGFDDRAFQYLSTDVALPSPGQGVWGVCALKERADIGELFGTFEDTKARLCARTELRFATEIGLPEAVPIAAWARAQRAKLMLDGCVMLPGAQRPVRLSISGPTSRSDELVSALVAIFRQQEIHRLAKTRK